MKRVQFAMHVNVYAFSFPLKTLAPVQIPKRLNGHKMSN